MANFITYVILWLHTSVIIDFEKMFGQCEFRTESRTIIVVAFNFRIANLANLYKFLYHTLLRNIFLRNFQMKISKSRLIFYCSLCVSICLVHMVLSRDWDLNNFLRWTIYFSFQLDDESRSPRGRPRHLPSILLSQGILNLQFFLFFQKFQKFLI